METGKANDAKPDLEKDAASPEVMVGAAVNLSTKEEWDQDLMESHKGDQPVEEGAAANAGSRPQHLEVRSEGVSHLERPLGGYGQDISEEKFALELDLKSFYILIWILVKRRMFHCRLAFHYWQQHSTRVFGYPHVHCTVWFVSSSGKNSRALPSRRCYNIQSQKTESILMGK